VGIKQNHWLGMGYYQLRMVGRYRPRRYIDFCYPFAVPQKWRTSINRAAEAMTIFAVLCAASFILAHMGRPWLAHWALPLPNTYGSLWVNFNSPLVWDVFAISTYLTVSLVFWYIGLIPDLATIRDRARNKVSKLIYGSMSFGWDGSAKTWALMSLSV
jgi:molybdopterin-containing oxidoreductase family membrane subunit